MLTRRDLMKLGLVGTGYILLPHDKPFAPIPSSFADDNFQSPFTRPWAAPLPLPAEPIPVPPFADCVSVDPVTGKLQYVCAPEYTRFVDNDTTFFEIVAEQRWVTFHPDLPYTSIWGYRDVNQPVETASILGPTFKARYGPFLDGDGKPKLAGGVYVRHHNRLPLNHTGFGVTRLTVHHHGGHHFARADGFPDNNAAFSHPVVYENDREPRFYDYLMPMLDPGFVNDKDAGVPHTDSGETPSTLWYHDHILDFTGQNAYRGLAGFFLAFDDGALKDVVNKTAFDLPSERDTRGLQLPSGDFDVPIVIQDKLFTRDGALVYNSFDHDGFLGDKFVLNGAIQPFLRVQRRKYRFRFLNGSNARIYQLFLVDENGVKFPQMHMIATEGGLLSHTAFNLTSFMLAMAERVEVVIDFTDCPNGTELFIENRLRQDDGRRADGLMSRGPQILKFIVDGFTPALDPSKLPRVLRPFEPVSAEERATAVRRSFRFDRSHGAWAINGELAGHLDRVDANPREGVGEIWRIANNSGGWWHPIHIHSEYFRVLTRNGRTPAELQDGGAWVPGFERDGFAKKDTLLLRDNEEAEVFLKFRDYKGPFVFHCHNMEHEDMQMMARFDVV